MLAFNKKKKFSLRTRWLWCMNGFGFVMILYLNLTFFSVNNCYILDNNSNSHSGGQGDVVIDLSKIDWPF